MQVPDVDFVIGCGDPPCGKLPGIGLRPGGKGDSKEETGAAAGRRLLGQIAAAHSFRVEAPTTGGGSDAALRVDAFGTVLHAFQPGGEGLGSETFTHGGESFATSNGACMNLYLCCMRISRDMPLWKL